jgi:hypothetical protein
MVDAEADTTDRANKLAMASKRIFFIRLIFHFGSANKMHGTVLVERPARSRTHPRSRPRPRPRNSLGRSEDEDEDEDEKQKCLPAPQNGNEGIQRILTKTDRRAGLILLFAEKLAGENSGRDECNQTGILTSASILTPAFPGFRLVAMGVCSRYSGATAPDSHRVPRHLTAMAAETLPPVSKNSSFLR